MQTKFIERALFLVFLLYPIRFLISASFDNSKLVYAANMERIWISDGNRETWVAYLVYSLIILFLTFHLVINFNFIHISFIPVSALLLYLVGMIVNLNNWPTSEIIGIAVFFTFLLFASGYKWPYDCIHTLEKLQIFLLGLILLYPFFNFERSFSQCTLSKCTFFGKLFTSFFPHENTLALFLFLGSCLFISNITKKRVFLFFLHGFMIIATGSRLVFTIFILLTFAIFLKHKYIYIVILALVVASTTFYFSLNNPLAFTGRGQIFIIGREIFFDNSFFGYGFGSLNKAYSELNLIDYRVYHEHNGIGVILLRHGLLGLLAFCLFMFFIGTQLISKERVQLILLLAIVLTFPTESASDFSIQNYLSWGYIVAFISINPFRIRSSS